MKYIFLVFQMGVCCYLIINFLLLLKIDSTRQSTLYLIWFWRHDCMYWQRRQQMILVTLQGVFAEHFYIYELYMTHLLSKSTINYRVVIEWEWPPPKSLVGEGVRIKLIFSMLVEEELKSTDVGAIIEARAMAKGRVNRHIKSLRNFLKSDTIGKFLFD